MQVNMNEKNSCGFSTEYISYSVFVLVWHLLINSQFSKSKVDDNYHTYNNTLSINHSKIGNRPEFYSTFVISYCVE